MEEVENEAVDLVGAAFQSRLPHNELSPLEKSLFPAICEGTSEVLKAFLQIRNQMLQLWIENPKVELIYEMAVQNIPDSKSLFPTYMQLSLQIHKYLEIHGYINFGIFKRIHPIRRVKKCKVIVIGAGMAGLAAARQLTSFGMEVVVVEARDRVGGRISTFRKGKYVADLGAMVVTGLGGNPITVISKQINMELHKIKQDCPLYETGGQRVPKEKDVLVEQEFNKLLEATAHLSHEMNVDHFKEEQLSLGRAFELVIEIQEKKVKEQLLAHWHQIHELHKQLRKVLQEMCETEKRAVKLKAEYDDLPEYSGDDIKKLFARKRKLRDYRVVCKEYETSSQQRVELQSKIVTMEQNQPSDVYLSSKDRQLLDWHLANLEFANATPLNKLSLKHWNQAYAHCAVVEDVGEVDGKAGKPIFVSPSSNSLSVLPKTQSRAFDKYRTEILSSVVQALSPTHSPKTPCTNIYNFNHCYAEDDAYEFSGSHLVVRNGYSSLPIAYADSLNIRLNTAVRKITYTDQGCQVVVQSTQVNSPPSTLECDAVLCTLPLGVLRPPHPELDHGPNVVFDPPLPDWKMAAVKRMGFGNLNKIVLCFERPFWDSSASNLFGHIGSTTSSRGELFLFWAIYRAPVLIALVAGEAANVMEHVGDGVVISRTLAVLKGIFGSGNVPDPLSYTVTRWGSDPWSRGSYSYVATGSSGDDYDVMATPVNADGSAMGSGDNKNPVLFFAGEHTMRNYPATVHGALLSGFREAARIAEIFMGPANTANEEVDMQES